MTSFSTVFSKNRRIMSFGWAILLFLLVVFSPNMIRVQLGNIANTIFYYFFSQLKNYQYDLQSATEENQRLKNLTVENSLQLAALAEAQRENQRLREFLGFEPPDSFSLVPVKIVSLVQNIYPVAAVINKGRHDSLMVDMPIINRFGLVGKISEVMEDFAVVSLLTDPSNAVSGRVAESRQIGIVRFSSQSGMYLDNLPADARVNPGDLIITSGLGGVYPAGLSVAFVDSVRADRGDILKTVLLKPTVKFFEIDELYVLVSEK
ncbi:MAG: rod shape-determining protein MreC [Candidatus Zixiibacteriota bacterium]